LFQKGLPSQYPKLHVPFSLLTPIRKITPATFSSERIVKEYAF
jgi:hypothetical protein